MSYLHSVSAERIVGLGVCNPESRRAFLTGPSGLGKANAIPKLSAGQYGVAMSREVPVEAVRLLLLSKKFREMAQVLDAAYVDVGRWMALPKLTLDNDFRVPEGTFKGRRVLSVWHEDAGSIFIPGPSIESPQGWDIIRFKTSLSKRHPLPWVEAVAHESAHAVARVTARRRGPSTAVQRVRAAVLDECNAREVEQQVLAEIRTTKAGKAALAGYPPLTPVCVCDCERDFFPVAQKRTYLEQFVLGDWELATQALGTIEIEKVTTDVAAIPLLKPRGKEPSIFLAIMRGGQIGSFATQFPVLQSTAGQAAFVLRLLDESWRQLIGKLGETSDIWLGAKELRLQRHARLFFKIPVSYTTKCPKGNACKWCGRSCPARRDSD